MVLGKLCSWFYWQNCGESIPCLVTNHHTPAVREVSGRERTRLSREAMRGLQEIARRRSMEAEVSRARRRAASALRGPGSRCPGWLLTLLGGHVP